MRNPGVKRLTARGDARHTRRRGAGPASVHPLAPSKPPPAIWLPHPYSVGLSSAWTLGGGRWMGADGEPLRLRRGEPDAFDARLSRCPNRLYRYLVRLTANPAVAEDLFQETWLRVITR